MDKYVLVPQERYDTMLKKEKGNNSTRPISAPSSQNSVQPPPPGLPPSDSLAQNGIDLSDDEAEQLSKSLMDMTYKKARSLNDIDVKDRKEDKGDWKSLWKPIK